jgi:peptidoglycan L-alanyl-D-glutamate endopeptidase CwlK
MTPLVYGKASEAFFRGVHPDVVAVARLSLKLSSATEERLDWSIVDGLRTPAQQAKLVELGKSHNPLSPHLAQPPLMLGEALDFRIWLGKGVNPFPLKGDSPAVVREKLSRHERVAALWFQAADELDVPWQWGNDWDADGIPTGRDPDEKGMLQDMVHMQKASKRREAQARARRLERIALRASGVPVVS